MAKDVTRTIKPTVAQELWGRAAGRCQFDGCNRVLFQSPVTSERVNIAEKAHIYSYSQDGPRGRGIFAKKPKMLNDIGNLMLVCHDCHRTIDQDTSGERYSADLLRQWKSEHEERIAIVASVRREKRSNVILYGARIGGDESLIQPEAAKAALFPEWYPSSEHPVALSMKWERRDDVPSYWENEEANLVGLFDRKVRPLLGGDTSQHCSIFALAPIPLLIRLGALFTDKSPVQVYQLHREPQTWRWLDGPTDWTFEIVPPMSTVDPPALVISLSDKIADDRITAVTGDRVSIWQLTIPRPNNDFLRTKDQLALFRETARRVIREIGQVHGKSTPLQIFPAMPVACAVELGRIRMPKADGRWIIYDQQSQHGKFLPALTLGAITV